MKCGDVINVIEHNEELKKAVDVLIMAIPEFKPEDLDTFPDWIYDLLDDDIKKLIQECLYRRVMEIKKSGAKEGKVAFVDLFQEVCDKLQDKLMEDDKLRAAFWGVIFDKIYQGCKSDDEFTTRIITLSQLTKGEKQ